MELSDHWLLPLLHVSLRLVGGTVLPCSTQQQASSHWKGSHHSPPTAALSLDLPVTVRGVVQLYTQGGDYTG